MTAIEERLAVFSRLPGDVVALIDVECVTRYVSPSVERTLGYRPADFLETSLMEMVHPEDLDHTMTGWQAVLAQPDGHERWEHRVRHADGTWRWLEVVATNTLSDPDIGSVFVNFRDISERKEAEQALRASESRFRALVQNSYDVFAIIHPDRGITYASPSLEELFGRPIDNLIGTNPLTYIHPDDLDSVAEGYVAAMSTPGKRATHEARILRADGTYRWIDVVAVNLVENEAVEGVVVNIRDVTEQKLAEQESERLINIFEATEDIVAMADRRGGLIYFNRAAHAFFGLDGSDDLSGFDFLDVMTSESVDRVTREVEPELMKSGTWYGELELLRSDGSATPYLVQALVHRDHNDNPEFFSAILHDISDRKAFEHRLAHQATHDPLTGLPNRTLLLDRLETAMARAQRHEHGVAVLFLDLDHFKVVNDSLGHSLGDHLLVAIAERLQTALRPVDTTARLGGDEFVVLCEEVASPEDAVAIAERLDESLQAPFMLGETEAYVGVSIGIAYTEPPLEGSPLGDHATRPGTLIRDADAAMYEAKRRGRGRWVVFDQAMRTSALERLDTENALRRALERRELRVHYQPIVTLSDGKLCGVEALLRWQHPERGLLPPSEFIRLAEDTGLIVPIGTWVMQHACRQVQLWQRSMPELGQLVLSVNLSGRQLGNSELIEQLKSILDDTDLDPGQLELEITESVLMDDVELSQQTLQRLRRLGVRLVVDDFGTGYSSLSYLRRFPVDLIKVDRSFVRGLGTDGRDSAIVAAVVGLAHTLGLSAVGEGVETAAQLDALREMGCDRAQGFHIARPAPATAIGDLLSRGTCW